MAVTPRRPRFAAVVAIAAGVAGVAASFGGCFVAGFEKVPASGGGGGGGAGGAGGEAPDTCAATGFPRPNPDATDGEGQDLFFAIRSLDFGETELATRPGFNLDLTCSCCEGCSSDAVCTPPSTATPSEYCDAVGDAPNGGIDNSFANLVAKIVELDSNATLGSAAATQNAESGSWSVLVRLWNYNGSLNDSRVSVALYTTPGLGAAPAWDGTDVWPVRSDSLAQGSTNLDEATIRVMDAYVTNGTIVGVFDSGRDLTLNLDGGFRVKLGYAIFTAQLKTEGGVTYLADGTIGGMWSMGDVFAALGAIREGAPLCTNDTLIYPLLKSSLCDARDSRIGNPQPLPCDAISFGMDFTAHPIAPPAPIVDPVPPTDVCPPEFDPTNDSCPS